VNKPAVTTADAMASITSRGAAVTSPPGSVGTCVKFTYPARQIQERSDLAGQEGLSLARKVATSTTHAMGPVRRESPYRARVAPTSTQTAGSRTTAASRSVPKTLRGGGRTRAGARLEETARFFEFLINEMPSVLEQ
jgi:hypothetical protein